MEEDEAFLALEPSKKELLVASDGKYGRHGREENTANEAVKCVPLVELAKALRQSGDDFTALSLWETVRMVTGFISSTGTVSPSYDFLEDQEGWRNGDELRVTC